MIVVADTSPIGYLVRIGEVELLEKLYRNVLIPRAVLEELRDVRGLAVVQDWAKCLPDWVEVRPASYLLAKPDTKLHRGEIEAIALAEEMKAVLLLIDDRAGAQAAMERGLHVTGTLGVLVAGAQSGLIEIEGALRKLRETNFRARPGLYERAIELAKCPRT